MLCNPPILAFPRKEGKDVIDMDASYDQLGCSLLQEQPSGENHPVGYFSKGLTPVEKNYTVTEIEGLGVVWAVSMLRPYIEGTHFLIRCDHLALRWVLTRGCHGYITEDYIGALDPYPLRIRAGDAYPKCIMRKGGEDISILSDRNCEIISDPYPRYESQHVGIYMVLRLPASGEFWLNAVDLSFRVPTDMRVSIQGYIWF